MKKNQFNSLLLLLCFFGIIFRISAQQTKSKVDPQLTEVWEPVPKVVKPGKKKSAPSDAIVLFNGQNLNEWQNINGEPAHWDIKGRALFVVPGKSGKGHLVTKRKFRDVQLHIEWRSPKKIVEEGQGRGNSGIFFMKRYELQVLDSYHNRTYSNGQAGSIYKQHPPLVNASTSPGTWQTYDIIFTAPVLDPDGHLVTPAYMTVFHNGILIQNHVALKGPMVYRGQPKYKLHEDYLPLMLQQHKNKVSYRNIWIREL